MTLPFAGHPVGARNSQDARNDEDKIHSAYRFLLGDLMPFGKNAVLLDTRKVEGGGDWSGSFVGTSFIFTHRNVLTTLEGDPRFISMTANHRRLTAPAPRSGEAGAIIGALHLYLDGNVTILTS